jgi:hypothetical protein
MTAKQAHNQDPLSVAFSHGSGKISLPYKAFLPPQKAFLGRTPNHEVCRKYFVTLCDVSSNDGSGDRLVSPWSSGVMDLPFRGGPEAIRRHHGGRLRRVD